MLGVVLGVLGLVAVLATAGMILFVVYRKSLREAKNYERGLKMVPMMIHLPPASEDIDGGSRDQRELTEEVLSQAQVMYNVIASTATKGFSAKVYGQRHISFEMVARDGLVYYYAVVPIVLIDVVKQAVAAAYPSARLEEVEEHNIFSEVGKLSGTIGGEFTLKKSYVYPIATYEDTKRDASRALLNALSSAKKDDGIGIQLLIRPAHQGWAKFAHNKVENIKKDRASGKKSGSSNFANSGRDIMTALWKPPSEEDHKEEKDVGKQLTAVEQKEIEAIEEKIRYPGYEILVRAVVSSNTSVRSQTLMSNIVSAFALFDSQSNNGFKFAISRNIEELVTSYIFRFFPQSVRNSILNSVELATVFHLPDQNSIPTSQVKRQMSKQVDGPTDVVDDGLLIGYNEFRGVKKPIRLGVKDRRRHIHIIGQTGVGKSVLQENLAYQDMLDGRGMAFVDPHGDSVEKLLSIVPKDRVEDVIYFNPSDMDSPIGLNMFEFDHPDQKDFLVQEAISMLYGLYDPGHTGIVGPRLEHIFRNCALLLMSDPEGGTFIDIPKVLIDQDFMKSKLKHVTDQQVLDFWTKEFPASQRSNEAGEVISWVVSKFGPFISNDAMRNILGQTKSGFNFPDIMNNNKILLVNLSKGKMGDLNSKLIGIVFVMKFQAAAMARASMDEEDRKDFTMYVDEFQNFATDSFETILSEARKYRLSLVLGNQFMTQLKEELREAIIGNVGTTITGRIGITDAEIMVKRYTPTFEAEDLTKLPNYESVTVAQINGIPSAPFSMSWMAPMGEDNPKLADALKRLSAAKYGRPRAQVEKDIFDRLGSAEKEKKDRLEKMKAANGVTTGTAAGAPKPKTSGSSFLDEWLSKRQKLGGTAPSGAGQAKPPAAVDRPTTMTLPSAPVSTVSAAPVPQAPPQPTLTPQSAATGQQAPETTLTQGPISSSPTENQAAATDDITVPSLTAADDEILRSMSSVKGDDNEVHVKLR